MDTDATEPGEAPQIREYRADEDELPVSQPNVASSSVVLHLQVSSEASAEETHNYEREFLNYRPDVTLPYAYTEDDTFSVRPEEVDVRAAEQCCGEGASDSAAQAPAVAREPPPAADKAEAATEPDDEGVTYAVRVSSVLRDFERKSEDGEWPLSTSVSCYWCCHRFDGPPLGLPVKAFPAENGFYVTGCFCSTACASAFNLDSRDSHDTVCDRQAMLAAMARLIHGSDDVRAAPDWRALTKFGGYMGIEQFRGFSDSGKVLLSNVPPMRSLTTQLEEVNEGDVGSGYNFVPLDPVRIERGMQDLSLKRTKPRFDYKNSLDHSMHVVVHQAAAG